MGAAPCAGPENRQARALAHRECICSDRGPLFGCRLQHLRGGEQCEKMWNKWWESGSRNTQQLGPGTNEKGESLSVGRQ